jgi:hypothetical protein
MYRLLATTAIAAAVLTGPSAEAACVQAQAAGLWSAYSSGVQGGESYWVKCTLHINTAGNITDTSGCTNSAGRVSVVTGSILAPGNGICNYTGTITYKIDNTVLTIDRLTLAQNKEIMEGVGSYNNGFVTFNMVRNRFGNQ